jgi:hypothetical protein
LSWKCFKLNLNQQKQYFPHENVTGLSTTLFPFLLDRQKIDYPRSSIQWPISQTVFDRLLEIKESIHMEATCCSAALYLFSLFWTNQVYSAVYSSIVQIMYAQSQVNKNINCALWCKKCKRWKWKFWNGVIT